jgi:hypothetical protein
VTLPERPARSQVGSVLPPAPTVSSSRAYVDREPKLTAVKVTTASDNEDTSHGSEPQADSGDHDTNSDSDSDHDIGGHSAKIISATVRIGPPSRAKATQPSEAVPAAADTVTNHPHDLQLSFLTYVNNPSPLQITLRRPYPQVSKAEHNNPGTTKAPIVPRLAKTPSPCLDIAYSQ